MTKSIMQLSIRGSLRSTAASASAASVTSRSAFQHSQTCLECRTLLAQTMTSIQNIWSRQFSLDNSSKNGYHRFSSSPSTFSSWSSSSSSSTVCLRSQSSSSSTLRQSLPLQFSSSHSTRHFSDEVDDKEKEGKPKKKKKEVAIELSDDNIPILEWTAPKLSDEVDPRAGTRAKREERRANLQRKIERGAARRAAKLEKVKQQEKMMFEPDLRGIDVEKQNMLKDVLEVLPTATEEQRAFRDKLARIGSYRTASTAELRKGRLENIVNKYGKKPGDTGSTEVQVGILTERIISLQKTVRDIRGNIHARRYLAILSSRRRKLLKYLRRKNPISFEMVMKDLKLTLDVVDGEGRTAQSGNQAKTIPRSG